MKVFNKKGFAALAAVAILAAACGGSSTTGKTLTIGIGLPLNGSALASAGPARDGALLAIKEASIEGYTLVAKILDHAKEGAHNPDQAAADMLTFVGIISITWESDRVYVNLQAASRLQNLTTLISYIIYIVF